MAQEFCPRCGTPRVGALRFCRSCGLDFDAPPAVGGRTPSLVDEPDEPEVGRVRAFLSPWLLHIGLGLGAATGSALGLATERGVVGIVTVGGAIVGGGIGLYIGQSLAMAQND